MGKSIEWLTDVSQVVGSLPDVFSCELNFNASIIKSLNKHAKVQNFRGSLLPFYEYNPNLDDVVIIIKHLIAHEIIQD